MEYITVQIDFSDESFHPVDKVISEHSDRERIENYKYMFDGSALLLYKLSSVSQDFATELENAPRIISYGVFTRDDDIYLLTHVEKDEPLSTLLSITHDYPIIVGNPIEIKSKYSFLVRGYGMRKNLREALLELPDQVDISIKRSGTYTPQRNEILDVLTERQREVLEVAFENGYYRKPRKTTQDDIGDEVGIASTTVNSVLRAAENRVMERLLSD